MKKYILIFISVLTLSTTAKAQDGFENILLGSSADATKLMEGYFSPAMEGFIFGMNNGWYHTAKVHKVLGFDISVGLSAAMVPSSKEMFSLSGLTSVKGGTYSGPTFAGDGNGGNVTFEKTLNGNTVEATMQMPGGVTSDLPLNAIPAPLAQVNIGLPFKMEAMVRYFPETDLGDDGGKAKMLGLGIKKEITSWFGPLDKLPLHVSLLAAYTSMDLTYAGFDTNGGSLTVNNGKAAFELKAYTVEAIASLNFPFINVYGGFGYSSGNSSFNMTGTYQGSYTQGAITETQTLTPPSMDFEASGVKTTVGARISLWFLKVFANYTIQEYNTLSAGVAISIR